MSAPIYHFDIEQGSDAWHEIRAGKWSASHAATIMGSLDTKGLSDLVMTVAWGRVFGALDEPQYKSPAMERGNALEDSTRERYMFQTEHVIEICGFVEHAHIPYVGWSPDGLVGRTHAIETKNPLHKAWMECLRTQKIPAEYRWQCKWAAWVGQLESLDFLVDHPKAGLIVIPCELPTESEMQQMAERVLTLEKRVAEWIDMLASRKP